MRALVFLLPLAACASAPVVTTSAPSTEVRVAVVRPCLSVSEIPPTPVTAMPRNGDVKQKAAGAAADVLAMEAHNAQLYALLRACAGGENVSR